jgi:hypothetical protein
VRLRNSIPVILSFTVFTHVSSGDTDRQTGSGLNRGLNKNKACFCSKTL